VEPVIMDGTWRHLSTFGLSGGPNIRRPFYPALAGFNQSAGPPLHRRGGFEQRPVLPEPFLTTAVGTNAAAWSKQPAWRFSVIVGNIGAHDVFDVAHDRGAI